MTDCTALHDSLIASLCAAQRSWTRAVSRCMTRFGLTGGAGLALIAIVREGRQGGGMHQVAIAAALGISDSSLVRFIDQLCEAGLVERLQDEANRRAKTILVTSQGDALSLTLEAELGTLIRDALGPLPTADLRAASRVAVGMIAMDAAS